MAQNPLNKISGTVGIAAVAASKNVNVGINENVWLKGADNGVTNTYDGIHYSGAGETACAAQWKAVLGL